MEEYREMLIVKIESLKDATSPIAVNKRNILMKLLAELDSES